jgi:general secretion pathway protein L
MASRRAAPYDGENDFVRPFWTRRSAAAPRGNPVMASLRWIIAWLSGWIDDVAAAVVAMGKAFRPTRKVRLVEQADGTLLLQIGRRRSSASDKGQPLRCVDGRIEGGASARICAQVARSRVEIELLPSRFVFRPLELPRRASEFLEGIIRAQIDRLTPWPPAQAAFGWSVPTAIGGERVRVTVAATARDAIASLAQAIEELKPDSMIFATQFEEPDAPSTSRIQVFEQHPESQRRTQRVRRLLIAALASVALFAVGALGAWIVFGGDLDQQRLDLARQLAARRVALMSGRGSAAEEATAALGRKKHETPAAVIVLDSLSQALPDDTYLTELRVEEGKLQVAGLTRDAPTLIRTIEQNPQFTRATFFAPTTRSPTENGERFHIEAHIEPFFPAGP